MSLAGQRADIERFASENNFKINRWYEDDGISGDATEKRAGFQEMHRAATNGRDFDVIIVWDLSRFGRFDSIEAGRWIDPLRRAGVKLVTVKDGPADWNSFEGRVMSAINSEAKHQFLKGIAESASRGKVQRAQEGRLCGQAAPYGYDRMEVDQQGQQQGRLATGSRVRNRLWRVTLVPSDDPVRAETLKWLFDQYANTDIGLRSLAESLNGRGIPSPRDGAWWIGTVREILRNEVYTGDFIWAKRQMGKYRRISGTSVKKCESVEMTAGGNPSVRRNTPEEWIVVKNAHPALIDRSTFERVQEKLALRKTRTTSNKKKNGDRYLLTGIVRCGHCGAKMYGTRGTRRKNGTEYVYDKYICSTYHTQGKGECGHHAVDQGVLAEFIISKLREAILAGGKKDELRQKVRQRLSAKKATGPGQTKALTSRLAELDRAIVQGTKRVLAAPDDVADLLTAELSNTRKERDHVAAELEHAKAEQKPIDLEAEVEAAVAHLWTLAADLNQADPARLRELFNRMVESIELWFDHVPRGKKTICPLSKGVVNLRPDSTIFRLVSRDDRI
jgi:site-specific DNA recombinase